MTDAKYTKPISSKVDEKTKRRMKSELARLQTNESKFLRDLVEDYFNPKESTFETETTQKLELLTTKLEAAHETIETLTRAMVQVRTESRRDLAAFFKVILLNPELLPDPKKASKKNIEQILAHIGMSDV